MFNLNVHSNSEKHTLRKTSFGSRLISSVRTPIINPPTIILAYDFLVSSSIKLWTDNFYDKDKVVQKNRRQHSGAY